MKKRILSAVLACAATMTFTASAFAEDAVTTAEGEDTTVTASDDDAPADDAEGGDAEGDDAEGGDAEGGDAEGGESEEDVTVIISMFTVDDLGTLRAQDLNKLLLEDEDGTKYSWSDVDEIALVGDGSFTVAFLADEAKVGSDVVILGETELPEEFDEDVVIVDMDISDLIPGEGSDDPASDAEGGDDSGTTSTEGEPEPAAEVEAPAVLAPVVTSDDADGAANSELPSGVCVVAFNSNIIELFDSSVPYGGELAIVAKEGTVNVQAVVKMKDGAVGTPSTTEGDNNSEGTTTNPGTGIALAVAPAALAVAFVSVAAVASKKKKG